MRTDQTAGVFLTGLFDQLRTALANNDTDTVHHLLDKLRDSGHAAVADIVHPAVLRLARLRTAVTNKDPDEIAAALAAFVAAGQAQVVDAVYTAVADAVSDVVRDTACPPGE